MPDLTTRDRVAQTLRFLRELHLLRTKVVRNVHRHQWSFALADLPVHPHIMVTRATSDEDALFRLAVRRVEIPPCPSPPADVRSRLPDRWNEPVVDVTELVDQDDAEPLAGDIEEALTEWLISRDVWATAARPLVPVQELFQHLHDVWLRIERESESWDFVLADALLEAPAVDDGERISHPLLLQRLEVRFDGRAGVIEVVEGDAEPRLAGSVVRLAHGFADAGLQPIQDDVNRGGIRMSRDADMDAFLSVAVNHLFPNTGRVAAVATGADTTIRRFPMLVLMRRVPGIADAIDRYLAAFNGETVLPSGLRRVMGDFGDSGGHGGRSQRDVAEVLLTKDANADQEQVVTRLAATGAVLVQGPPGTGKTHTIANLIGHLLAHGKTVLVTSQTTKALRVVRDKVVPELQPLCVSVLEADTTSRNQLEASVAGIVGEFTRTSENQLRRGAETAASERIRLKRKIAELEAQFKDACVQRGQPLRVDGKSWDLEDAGKWLCEHAGKDGWVPGEVDAPSRLSLTTTALERLYALNVIVSDEDVSRLTPQLPEATAFPGLEEVQELAALLALREAADWESAAQNHRCATQRMPSILAALQAVTNALAQAERFPAWLRQVADDAVVGSGRLQQWVELADAVDGLHRRAAAFAAVDARLRPVVTIEWTQREQLEVAVEVAAHVDAGRAVTFWSTLRRPRWKKFAASVTVAGRAPSTAEDFVAVRDSIGLRCELEDVAGRWDALVGGRGGPTAQRERTNVLDAIHLWSGQIRSAVAWACDDWRYLEQAVAAAVVAQIPQLEGQDTGDAQLTHLARRIVALRRLQLALEAAREQVVREVCASWHDDVVRRGRRARGTNDETRVGQRLCDALKPLDTIRYRQQLDALSSLSAQRKLVLERERLLGSLQNWAPHWASQIRKRQAPHAANAPPGDIEAAIAWRRLQQAFEERNALDPVRISRDLSACRESLRDATAQYVKAKAWLAQRGRVDGPTQQALIGWSDVVRHIGRGTGLRAPQYMAEARKLLSQCRDAVPVWIMPLARALESYDLSQQRFDVVIIDEASQLDVLGLVVLALADEVVVVGDNEQVTPAAVGQQVQQVEALQRQYLDGVPNAILYDGKTSLYDLARQSFGEVIRLREHFRCAREVIEFSNQLCYSGEIQALRDTSRVLTVPHVVPVRVPGFRSDHEKLNEVEVEYVVALIVAMLERPEYSADCTFGVVSLLGEEQAVRIDRLLSARIPQEERARRRLICGTAAQFQGDERDVMILSMVDSSGIDGPLANNDRPEYRQRLNVAASRARDQQWVVHSLNPATDLKPTDLRRRFLEYVHNAGVVVDRVAATLDAAESPFEREVMRRLLAAGYQVVPQWPVGGYRIDFVVEGAPPKRLAVECDGDQFHGLDRVQADLERQTMLERLGWTFHRIRGGAFYRDPDAEMRKLLKVLAEMDILPVATDVCGQRARSVLAAAVLDRARELLVAWAAETQAPGASAARTAGAPAQEREVGQDVRSSATTTKSRPTPTRARAGPNPLEPQRAATATVAHPPVGASAERRSAPSGVQLSLLQPVRTAATEHVGGDRKAPPTTSAVAGRSSATARARPTVGDPAVAAPASAGNVADDPIKVALRRADPRLATATCEKCASRVTLFVGRRGPFLKCSNRDCAAVQLVPELTLVVAAASSTDWTCATCNAQLAVQVGYDRTWLQCAEGHREQWKSLRARLTGGGEDASE